MGVTPRTVLPGPVPGPGRDQPGATTAGTRKGLGGGAGLGRTRDPV